MGPHRSRPRGGSAGPRDQAGARGASGPGSVGHRLRGHGDPRRLRPAARRPAEVPVAGPALPALLCRCSRSSTPSPRRSRTTATATGSASRSRRHPHRPLGAGGAGLAPVRAERRGAGERRPADRRPVLPAHRPADEAELRRRRQGPRPTCRPTAGHKSATGKITAAPGYTILNARQVNARNDLKTFAVPTPDGGGIKRVGLSEAFEGKPTVSYDKADRHPDRHAPPGSTYVARNAQWVPRERPGLSLPPGLEGERRTQELHQRADRPDPARRLRQDLPLEHVLRGVLGARDVPARLAAGPAVQRRPDQAARRSTGRC